MTAAVPFTIVDAFTDTPFRGNPAAVCELPMPLSDEWMAAVAAEFNLPMTAFVVRRGQNEFGIRWFTPVVEVDLCGHATIAATHVLGGQPVFDSKSGPLPCRRGEDGTIELNFPAIPVAPAANPRTLMEAAGVPADAFVGAWEGGEWALVEVDSPEAVRRARPDAAIGFMGIVVVVAAPGERGADSACRVFEPSSGLPEDPVTGSAHCVIAPWLAERTGRTAFRGEQLSARGGTVEMRLEGDRVVLRGRATTVAEGRLLVGLDAG